MMGRLKSEQGQLFYEFHLGDAVPEDHLVRKIDTALDLSWLRTALAPHYSSMGRPSIDRGSTHRRIVGRKCGAKPGKIESRIDLPHQMIFGNRVAKVKLVE